MRNGYKLRGYFGNLFKKRSELLHNHMGNGELRYAYPQVQYKVIKRTPYLVGIKNGVQLLTKLFLKIKELDIGGKTYPVYQNNIEGKSHRYWVRRRIKNIPVSNALDVAESE